LSWHDYYHGTYYIPSLADLYILIGSYAQDAGRRAGKSDGQRANAARVIVDIELKSAPYRAACLGDIAGRAEEAIVEVTRKFQMAARARIRNFDHRRVRRVRNLEPAVTGV